MMVQTIPYTPEFSPVEIFINCRSLKSENSCSAISKFNWNLMNILEPSTSSSY